MSLEPTPWSRTGGSTCGHSAMLSSKAAPSTCKFRKNGEKQVGVQRVHNGNQMLKQQAIGKENTGSLGRVFWLLYVSCTPWPPLGHPHEH